MERTLVSEPGSGAPAHIRRYRTLVRTSGAATDGTLAVLEHQLPPGVLAMPRHSHAASVAVTVTSGELRVEIDGRVHALRAGDVAAIPPHVLHTYWVDPDAGESATFVAVVAPAGLERYLADVGAAIGPGAKPDMEAIRAAGARHGVAVELESLYELIERHTLQLS